jgi:hypothetical protein
MKPLKPRHFFIAALIIVALALLIIPNIANVTGTAPMLELPLLLRNRGKIVPHEEIRLIQYRFDEGPTNWDPLKERADMKEASPLGDGFLIHAPFTIMNYGGKKTISPRYRSLLIRVILVNGHSFSMSVPVISDKTFDHPIQIDFDFDKNES